jgi:putative ABC transport system ATP-binding protein
VTATTGPGVTAARGDGLAVRCAGLVHIWSTGQEEVVAVRGVDLDVAPGERVALLGPSGSGKSTLLSLLGGLLRPSAGQRWIGDAEISRLSQQALLDLRAARVGTVLQGAARNLLMYATARQNVAFAQRSLRPSARARVLRPPALLDALGLGAVADAPVARLSGGEQQRVALAVAAANAPGLLLADEPTSQLDTGGRQQVLDLLDLVNHRFGTTVVLVTHDPDVGAALDRTVTLRAGRVGQEGRLGHRYSIVADDGTVALPDQLLPAWPPGTRVEVSADPDVVHLARVSDEAAG